MNHYRQSETALSADDPLPDFGYYWLTEADAFHNPEMAR